MVNRAFGEKFFMGPDKFNVGGDVKVGRVPLFCMAHFTGCGEIDNLSNDCVITSESHKITRLELGMGMGMEFHRGWSPYRGKVMRGEEEARKILNVEFCILSVFG
jgi:hypothetical protein